jgi:hypothetical protein
MLDALHAGDRLPGLARLVPAARGRAAMPNPRVAPDATAQNTVAVSVGTFCNDVRRPQPVDGYAGGVAADRIAHPPTASMG